VVLSDRLGYLYAKCLETCQAQEPTLDDLVEPEERKSLPLLRCKDKENAW